MSRPLAPLSRSVLRRLVVPGVLLALVGGMGSFGCKDALDKLEKGSEWIIEPAPEPAAAAQFQLAEPYYVENQGEQAAAPAAPAVAAPGAPVAAARLAPVAGASVDTHVRVPSMPPAGAQTDGYISAAPSAPPAAPVAPVVAAPSAPSDDTWQPGPAGAPSLPPAIPKAPKVVAQGPLPAGKAGMDEAVRRLRRVMGINPRVTASYNIPNAAATVGHVMYNPNFFNQVRRKGGDSAVVGILAHEFGHLTKRHVYRQPSSSSSSRSKELEADNEAGCALAKLGMSAHGYVRVTTTLAGVGSHSHPGGAQRQGAIERGFSRCGGQGSPLVAQAPTGHGGGDDTIGQDDDDQPSYPRRGRRGGQGGYGGGYPGGGYGQDGPFGGGGDPSAGYPGRGRSRGQGGYPGGGGGYPPGGGYGGGGYPGGGGGYGYPGGYGSGGFGG